LEWWICVTSPGLWTLAACSWRGEKAGSREEEGGEVEGKGAGVGGGRKREKEVRGAKEMLV